MIRSRYVHTRQHLLALLSARRSFATDGIGGPATVRSRQDVSPFTLREGLFYETTEEWDPVRPS
jgi:hypothetical protein